jgi:hypothetical protein
LRTVLAQKFFRDLFRQSFGYWYPCIHRNIIT